MIEIQTNNNGYRILITNESIGMSGLDDLRYGSFDAVFIRTPYAMDMDVILQRINPITVNKASYKPFFASRNLKGNISYYSAMIDEYIDDINEEIVTQTIANIRQNIDTYHVPQELGVSTNHSLLILRIFRYYISRNHLILTPVIMEKSAMGYTQPLMEILHDWGLFHLRELYAWLDMSNAHGNIHYRKEITTTHMCPKCQHSHLIYLETCPNCGSSQLDYEQVIHHFACANISPEHTYNVGGQLICPKCHKQLRHIGIDYDRPAALYFCHNCRKSFLHPDMKAICTNCGTSSLVEELYPHKVHEIEITTDGINAFCRGQHTFTPYNDYFNNYMPMDAFENRLQMIASRKLSDDVIGGLFLIQVWITNEFGRIVSLPEESVAAASRLMPNCKLTSSRTMLFIQYTLVKGENDEIFKQWLAVAEERIRYLALYLQPNLTLHYGFRSLGDNLEAAKEFLAHWRILRPKADGDIHYDDVEHPEGIKPLDFITEQIAPEQEETLTETQQQLQKEDELKQELDDLKQRPVITKMVGYLSWGFVILGAIAILALILGYYLWLT